MKTKLSTCILACGITASLLAPINNAYACDECTQLENISDYLKKTLDVLSKAFFASIPDLGNTMSTFASVPSAAAGAAAEAASINDALAAYYEGQTDQSTLTTNYNNLFGSYMTDSDNTTFPTAFTNSSATLFNPSNGYYYSDTEAENAANYLAVLAGSNATPDLDQPSTDWLSTSSSKSYNYQSDVKTYINYYATLNAAQNLNGDNMSFIYGNKVGQTLSDSLDDYDHSDISNDGLMTYILSETIGNEDWFNNVAAEGLSAKLGEAVIGIYANLLMQVKIYQLQERILATLTAANTMTLLGTGQQTSMLKNNISKNS